MDNATILAEIRRDRLPKRLIVKATVRGRTSEYSFRDKATRDDFLRRVAANNGTAEILTA